MNSRTTFRTSGVSWPSPPSSIPSSMDRMKVSRLRLTSSSSRMAAASEALGSGCAAAGAAKSASARTIDRIFIVGSPVGVGGCGSSAAALQDQQHQQAQHAQRLGLGAEVGLLFHGIL